MCLLPSRDKHATIQYYPVSYSELAGLWLTILAERFQTQSFSFLDDYLGITHERRVLSSSLRLF